MAWEERFNVRKLEMNRLHFVVICGLLIIVKLTIHTFQENNFLKRLVF